MRGVLNYAVNGNTGDLDFTAKRLGIARTEVGAKSDLAIADDVAALSDRTTGLVSQKNSPRFRGVDGTAAYADDQRLSETWSRQENVLWSADVPGLGWACPVVWDDKVFVSTVVAESDDNVKPKGGLYLGKGVRDPAKGVHHWMVYCFDLSSGKEIWKHEAHVGLPKVPRHPKSTYAAETPTTDGERLYVLFGDLGLYCYDLDGALLWSRAIDPEKTLQDYGAAASPIVHDGQVIVVYDNFGTSWIAAFDTKTGQQRWRTERQETHSWATPLIWEHEQRTEIVVPGQKKNRSYDLDGNLLWEFDGQMSGLVIPSPFVAHGMCYIASGYVGDSHRPTFAVLPGASGDITPEDQFTDSKFIRWYRPTAAPYNTTQLVYGDFLYTLYDQGFLTCHNAKTGEMIYGKKRFSPGGSFTASPWAYNGKIFCLSEDGLTYVIKAGAEYELLHTNQLSELTIACPAVVDGKLLIRTASKLYCISNQIKEPE
ncbi:MAG: PQQ-binding-like beta-propeller repeat protein [Pirellulaceae bacterium]|nr:PQQ-binding-like beta-propeller repeat protein [Pirellulaceae bacterium]